MEVRHIEYRIVAKKAGHELERKGLWYTIGNAGR